MNGRLVDQVFDGVARQGLNEAYWDGTDSMGRSVAGGVYFYRLVTGETEKARKLVVIRAGE